MRLLDWKDEYSVGIEAVDHEHKELIALINRLYDELETPNAKLTVPAFFGDLLKAIGSHFALEEKFMREQGYRNCAISWMHSIMRSRSTPSTWRTASKNGFPTIFGRTILRSIMPWACTRIDPAG
jgi:hemerythrin-like metal-binding protein